MTSPFTRKLTDLIATTAPKGLAELPHVRAAFEDSLAVAFAGWEEPVTQKVASVYAGGQEMMPDHPGAVAPEEAATIYGTAIHALDFDDVHEVSPTHPTIPILAALLGALQEAPERSDRLATAFAIGLAANTELGRVLGFPHYEKGWHATCIFGVITGAAATAYLYGLDAAESAYALAIAAAQAGGLQRNFGAMAKPLQAGLSGAAGLRAARLARAGVTADEDVFGPKGFFDLYGGKELAGDPDQVAFDLDYSGIGVKLYPCCYNNHRPIKVALQVREALAKQGLAPGDLGSVEVEGPFGAFIALRVKHYPKAGLEAKFCGPYVVACTLLDGPVGLGHFEDKAVDRPEVRALFDRITLKERERNGTTQQTLKSGRVALIARDGAGKTVAQAETETSPGMPDDPPTAAQREGKVRDCLEYYSRHTGRLYSYDQFQGFISGLFAHPAHGQGDLLRVAAGD